MLKAIRFYINIRVAGNLLSNMEMDMITDVAPSCAFEDRKGTSVCSDCMFYLMKKQSKNLLTSEYREKG